jgi:PEP-CTERM motif
MPLCRSFTLLGAVLLPLLSGVAQAYTSATASASANEYSLLCGTCAIDFQDLGSDADGGPGAAEAHAQLAGGGYAGDGGASFAGPDALPELTAYAFAEMIAPTGADLHTYFYEAMGSASAIQQYTYLGAGPETYTIEYTLDGEFALSAADAASLMSVYGGVTVYGSPFVPGAEVNPTLDYDYQGDNASAIGTAPFLLTGSVEFTVSPGDIVYVAATLFATADSSHEVSGSVDALHTLSLAFTSGDASLLAAEATAVPEPGSAILLLAGSAILGAARRRGRAAV